MARGDELYTRLEVSFMRRPEWLDMSPHARCLYLALWCHALESRRQTVPRPSPRQLGAMSGLDPSHTGAWLDQIASCGLAVVTLSTIELVGIRAKHPRFQWVDTPYGDRTGPIRGATRARDTETDTDTETETEYGGKQSVGERAEAKKSSPRAPAAPLTIPEDLSHLALYREDSKLCQEWASLLPAWRTAYPGVDVLAEVGKAHAWEVSNPTMRKKRRSRFLASWLSRAQDSAGSRGAARPAHRESIQEASIRSIRETNEQLEREGWLNG